jgi:hypothetical protein
MTELPVHNFSISLDGYAAGPDQSEENRSASAASGCTSGSSRPTAGGRLRTTSSCSAVLTGSAPRSSAATCPAPSAARGDPRTGAVGGVVPVLLGDGERLFQNLGTAVEGRTVTEFAPSAAVAHVRLRRPSSVFDTMEV